MKIKSRSLLTVILALLCAAAVALGVGLILPKTQKINANAAATNTPQLFVEPAPTTQTGNITVTDLSPSIKFAESIVSSSLCDAVQQFYIKINVPAYTTYDATYTFKIITGIGGFAGSPNFVSANTLVSYHGSIGYGTGTLVDNLPFQHNVLADGKDKIFSVNNLIYANNTSSPQDFFAYFDVEYKVTNKNVGTMTGSTLTFESNTVDVTKLPVPKTTDNRTMDYDDSSHKVNFTYADTVNLTGRDGPVSYNTGSKIENVTVTVDALDGNNNPISSGYTLFTDPSQGSGYIEATDAGTYTVKFNLTQAAINNGIEWVGGGTERTLVLKINKINPTVTPDVGTGPFYTSNGLYTDVTINTTTGNTPGTIVWNQGQNLSAGTNNYSWTFTPTDTNNYNTKTGTASITVAGIEITGISATFNQGNAKFYTSNSLNDLKVRLAVDEVYNDGSTKRLADGDYTLSGNISSAGTCTVTVKYTTKNTEYPALEPYDDTFTVEITAVEITSISASFDPNGNDIYLSNSLDDLKEYLTVNATYNDGKTKNNVTNYTLSTDSGALALGTVTVTVTSDEDGTVIDTFDVDVKPDIVPVVLPLPQTKAYTYSGEELDAVGALTTLTDEQVVKYLDVSGNATARRAGEYTVKFKIKDEFIAAGNVSWDLSNLSSLQGVTVSADGNSVEFKWNILKAKVTAKWDEEECFWTPVIVGTLAETTEPDFLVNTYTNSDGKAFNNREKLAGGRTYQVTAAVNPTYAKNIELDESTKTLMDSGDETYTYSPPYVPTIWEKIVAFLKANWLWFVIAAAALILLIIIIVVAKKCHKTKEQREEIRARKEEERRRREEERRLQQERLQAERDLARAKQEAELEKIRAQAGMAAGAGMATMAMQQPIQQPVQQVMPQPVQYAQPQSMPMQQQMPQSYGGGIMERVVAELAAIREEHKSKTEAELANAKLLVEFERLRGDMRQYGGTPVTHMSNGVAGNAIPADVVIALIEAVKSGNPAPVNINTAPAALPQSVEESAPVQASVQPAIYPADAVITTTTTVDTTKDSKSERSIRRDDSSDFIDVDGFYDTFDM